LITETIRVIANVKQAISAFSDIGKAAESVGTSAKAIGKNMVKAGQKLGLAMAPLGAALYVAGNTAADFEQKMLGVSRALDLSGEDLAGFRAEVLEIAPPLGMLPSKFAELATEAGRLGVAKDAIMGFTTVVAEIAGITDLQGQEVTNLAKSFAALQTITGATTDELNIFGAAVNKMDDAVGGTTPQIVEFVRQTAATGKLLKLGVKDLAAYGSTMQALGIKNAVAYRSMNSMMTKLTSPQTLSTRGIDGLKALNIEVEEMSRLMTTDANKGINHFLTQIKKVSDVDVSKALGAVKDIMGADYADEILTLAVSHEKLGEALKFAGDEYDKSNLAKKNQELEKRLSGVRGQQAILNAQFERLRITIGSVALPAITDLIGGLLPLVDKFTVFAETNPEIVKFGISLVGVGLAVSPVLIVMGSLIQAISTLKLLALPGAILNLGKLAFSAKIAGAAIAGVSLPIAATLAGFVALGTGIGLLIANWDKLPPAVHTATSEAKYHLLGLKNSIIAFPGNIAQVPGAIGTILGSVGAKFTRLETEINYQLTRIKVALLNMASNAWNAGTSFIRNFGAGINNEFNKVIDRFRNQLNQLRGMLPGSEPKIPSPLSNLGEAGKATMTNFASGFSGFSGAGAMKNALGQTKSALVSPTGGAGGGTMVINDNRTIHINGGTGGSTGSDLGNDFILDSLRRSNREFLQLIERGRQKVDRTKF
jgi:TP901 family phage tail tape measure protein